MQNPSEHLCRVTLFRLFGLHRRSTVIGIVGRTLKRATSRPVSPDCAGLPKGTDARFVLWCSVSASPE